MTAIERFHQAIEKTEDCWLWQNALDRKGYARFRDDEGRKVFAHRFSYQKFVGQIPEGLTIDHLCRVRNCVNPKHLEAVSNAENIARGTQGQFQASKTHCRNGHEYSEENTYRHGTERQCRICRRINGKKSDARRRSKA